MKSGGRIIMIGSAVGERVMVPGLVPYSATKGAVKMFTQGLAREVGSRGITVNNIQPGPIDTELNPAAGEWAVPQKAVTALDRYGHVEEVAALVAFVAGPESSYITGANLTVDGGMNAVTERDDMSGHVSRWSLRKTQKERNAVPSAPGVAGGRVWGSMYLMR
jgi:3-oxoacyl-[acyl-carrier protein] reductase